ncbi:hypothetical protein AB0N07_17380 [Streptomyces sp. NPDC051172]|uniref:hypothetical protein n=1 Tax=Streptomyces sp. NPDC051172 TaxID=3155796 RepID=UPI00341DCC94
MRTGEVLRAGAAPGCVPVVMTGGLRARVVSHRSREVLDSGVHGGYATMGKKRQRAGATEELIGRRAPEGFRDRYHTGSPSSRAWQ